MPFSPTMGYCVMLGRYELNAFVVVELVFVVINSRVDDAVRRAGEQPARPCTTQPPHKILYHGDSSS